LIEKCCLTKVNEHLDWKFDRTKERKTEGGPDRECTINAQYKIHVNHPKKVLKGNFTASQGGLF
jgi:hypothetical protein